MNSIPAFRQSATVRKTSVLLSCWLIMAMLAIPASARVAAAAPASVSQTARPVAQPQAPRASQFTGLTLNAPAAITATCVVTNTNNTGVGALRTHVANAACNPITFDPLLAGKTITVTGEIVIGANRVVTIDGTDASGLKLSGNNTNRVFNVSVATGNLSLYNIIVQNGRVTAANGGAILNQGGTVSISNTQFLSNTAQFAGAIRNQANGPTLGKLTIYNSYFSNNRAENGGAITTSTGNTTIANSAFVGNRAVSTNLARSLGGAIQHVNGTGSPATTVITNTTFANNNARTGAALYNDNNGRMSVFHSTVSNNIVAPNGASVVSAPSSTGNPQFFRLSHTIAANTVVSGTNTPSVDLAQTNTATLTATYSLVENVGTTTFVQTNAGNITGVDPLLASLKNNGGSTPTFGLVVGSPAIDAGNPAFTPPPSTDQRGFARVVGARIDIGAFEGSVADTVQTGTLVVNTTADTGDGVCGVALCTLREAITAANTTATTDTITFNIAGTGTRTISLTSALPIITAPVILDATTQLGASCLAPTVELNGSLAGAGANGFDVVAGNTTIKGFIINRWSANGIRLATAGNNTVQCNWIGLDTTGNADAGNGLSGIRIENSPNNMIGGTGGSTTRNVVSGNDGNGIDIAAGSLMTMVQGNYVGTNSTGSVRVNNSLNGVSVKADQAMIGGEASGAGNVIAGNTQNGVLVNVPNAPVGSKIQGNFIGISVAGTTAISNTVGVFIDATPLTLVGGSTSAARNIISGNGTQGVTIQNAGATNNVVQNNYIGTNAGGTLGVANRDGIYIFNVANNRVISNTISANTFNGVVVGGGSATGTQIKGNFIGTNSANSTTIGNFSNGIDLDGSNGVIVGGALAGEGNVIGGNGNNGINIRTNFARNNVIKGNFIGVAPNGVTSIRNLLNGIRAANSQANTTNIIGGTAAGEANVIAFNTKNGVLVSGGAGYTIVGNSIFANTLLGIDLGADNAGSGDGVTANDNLDADTGANTLQNYPVLSTVVANVNNTQIQGTLNSTASSQFTIHFYTSADCDANNFGEGQSYLGSTSVTTDGSGNASFNVTLPVGAAAGRKLTATATNSTGSTSEFSQCLAIGNLPGLSVDDVTVSEGNAGTVNATFTLSLSTAAAQDVVVQYATSDGTAISPADYIANTGTVTITAGQTTATVSVQVNGDLVDELNETFFLNLLNATNASINDGQGQGTITDDDNAPTVSINDASVTEGNSGMTALDFTVTLSNPSSTAISVTYTTIDNTAMAPEDYMPISGTLTFAAGETSKTISVMVVGDLIDEADETFFVNLSNNGSIVISDAQGQGTIIDDDNAPTISIDDVTVTEGNTGSTVDAVFTVSLSNPSASQITVNYATANGTATATADYTSTAGLLTFAAGETSKTITVTVIGDDLDEVDETFFVNLTNASVSTSDAQGVGTINDDDDAPTLSIGDASILEGDVGTKTMVFTVTLSAASGQAVTLNYTTTNGTATAPADYTAASGSLTIPAGSTTGTINVLIKGDTIDESDETFTVTIGNASSGTISDDTATGTILDNEGLPTINISDGSVTEGDTGTQTMIFTVTLSFSSAQTVTVNYATADGTATVGDDYLAASGALTFAPGETSKTISVTINSDTVNEGNETFTVTLSNPVNANLGDAQGTGTIVDDQETVKIYLPLILKNG